MNLGRYQIETYTVMVGGQPVQRNRIRYTANNGIDSFVERYYGEVRAGYSIETAKYVDLTFDCVQTHVTGKSIVIKDRKGTPLLYLSITNIQSIQRNGTNDLVIIDELADPVTLSFASAYDSNQAYSMLQMVVQNDNVDLNSVGVDRLPPQVFFNDSFFGAHLVIPNTDYAGPYSTNDSRVFECLISNTPLPLTKKMILDELVYAVVDNRDEDIHVAEGNISIYRNGISVDEIVIRDLHTVILTMSDSAGNSATTNINIHVN